MIRKRLAESSWTGRAPDRRPGRVTRERRRTATTLCSSHSARASSSRLPFGMPNDAERWRFLADHSLTLHTDGGDYGYMVHWCRTAGPGEPPAFYPVSNGRTADEAIDIAIERYQTKHGRPYARNTSAPPVDSVGVIRLAVRGWVS